MVHLRKFLAGPCLITRESTTSFVALPHLAAFASSPLCALEGFVYVKSRAFIYDATINNIPHECCKSLVNPCTIFSTRFNIFGVVQFCHFSPLFSRDLPLTGFILLRRNQGMLTKKRQTNVERYAPQCRSY
jgi:hypothetical protein